MPPKNPQASPEGIIGTSIENPDSLEIRTQHGFGLVHILTPEFQDLNPADFDDIPLEIVAKASPGTMRKMLIDVALDGHSSINYQPPESGRRWIRIAVTPHEFNLFSRHIPMLAKTAINGVLDARDAKLQEETGNPWAKARTADDLAAAARNAVHSVRSRQHKMAEYLKTDIDPRIELIDKFMEMISNPNLVRGSRATVKQRFEELRLVVFGDMLDAMGNQQNWKQSQAERAVRILQKRLYLEPDPIKRRKNFEGMLKLADRYYMTKKALVRGRIEESQQYFRAHPEVVQNIAETELERNSAK